MDKKTGLLLMASALTACSPATGGHIAALPLAGAAASHARSHGRAASGPIQHVVVLIQENRSFDELFQGYPGANTVTSGLTSSGQTVPLQPVTLKTGYDLTHGLADYLSDYDNGAMDGFNLEHVLGKTNLQFPEYAYVPQSETGLYFQLAQQYVLSDDTFASNLDDSFVAHQYLIAAQANSAVDLPTSAWGCNGGPNDRRTARPAVPSRRVSTPRRWATNSMRPGSGGATTRRNSARRAAFGLPIRPSITSATATTGPPTSCRRRVRSSPTSRRATCAP